MKNRLFVRTILISALLVFTVSLTAQPRMGRRQGRQFTRPRSGGLLMVLKAKQQELNVTDDQLARITDLQEKLEKQSVEHRNAMNTQRLELRQGMRDKENIDFEELKAQLSKNAQARIDFQITKMKLQAEIANVLTDEQKAALKTMRQDRIRRGRGMVRNRNPRMNSRGQMFRDAPRIRRFKRDPMNIR
jgi:Spy/CpxP family protein refolding chaperone